MRTKIFISVFDMEIGGVERSLINMLEGFNYEKFEVDLFICHHSGDFMSLIPPQVNVLPEVPAYTVFRKSVKQCVKEGHVSALLIRAFSKTVAGMKARRRKLKEGPGYIQMQLDLKYTRFVLPPIKKQYDLAISYAWPHDIVATKVAAAKKLAWIHTDYSELEIDNHIDLAVWNKFDVIASISEACTDAFLTKYPSLKSRVTLIENITSPSFIRKMANNEQPQIAADKMAFTLVSVGRLSYVKGFDMAIQALRGLHDKGLTNIRWLVVGYGGFEAELKKLIVEYKVEESFLLLGKKTNPYPYIKACDVYVQPSRYEGKAVTVTEAKILGKPILITKYSTSSSQIQEGLEGVICELSVEGIIAGIEKIFWDKAFRQKIKNYCENMDYENSYELNKIYNLL
ncbi:glycosyl transferase [Paenibacillus pectinilyticus]|uniref:Glycosyl transferase n=1 Tax=Paenibacillus pectinilyticus TaxID=512399 RepID=A0A1C0ZSK3_9BACL|nr:glycosyltransferase [Paenibacillus pectinilyticus]OCT11051.1 glycosyl transferase [Paenibacillus pectinilyticus]